MGYREISFEDETRRMISKLGDKKLAEAWSSDSYTDRLGRTAQVFSVARLCARRGRRDLANTLLAKLGALRVVMPNSHADEPLEEELQQDFAELLRWNALRAVSAQGFTRTDLLAQLRQIETLCPAMFDLKEAQIEIAHLEAQLKEDAVHPTVSDVEFAAMMPSEKAAELAFRLRDETAKSFGDWPYADPHEQFPSNGSYAGLVGLGFDAVPALIGALSSEGKTRSVQVTMRYGGGCWLLSIHDIAIAALNDIAGINFYWQVQNYGIMKHEDSEPLLRKEIADWWKEVSQKDEEAYLIKKLRGDGNAENIGPRLLNRYPEDGLREVIKIAKDTGDGRLRSKLIKLLWKHDTPECRAFFEDEIRSGPAVGNRVAAAYGLRILGDSQAVSAMRAEWGKILRGSPRPFTGPPASDDTPESPVHVAAFLASSAAPEAILALGPDSGDLPVEWSARVIELLSERLAGEFLEEAEAAAPATKLAIEDVLVSFLGNKTSCGRSQGGRGMQIIHGRLCDYAGARLHELWPERYHFNSDLAPLERDRQCIQCRNVRLGELREPLLPVPEESHMQRLSPAAAYTIVRAEWAATSKELAGPWRAKVDALKGQRLESGAIESLLKGFVRKPLKGVCGISLEMVRYGDLGGVTLFVQLRPGAAFAPKGYCDFTVAGMSGSSMTETELSKMDISPEWRLLKPPFGRFFSARGGAVRRSPRADIAG